MADTFTLEERSEIMSRIRSKDTAPETAIRKYLHRKGIRYRLHVKELPGKPDIVLKKYNAVILYNGCFWHGHKNCKYAHLPKSNTYYWKEKIGRNASRDKRNIKMLRDAGWRLLLVWECSHRGKGRGTLESVCSAVYDWLLSASEFNEINKENIETKNKAV